MFILRRFYHTAIFFGQKNYVSWLFSVAVDRQLAVFNIVQILVVVSCFSGQTKELWSWCYDCIYGLWLNSELVVFEKLAPLLIPQHKKKVFYLDSLVAKC